MEDKHKAPDHGQKFIRNNKYFTICIYAFILVVISTIAIRAIVQVKDTTSFFSGLIKAISPFLMALLISYLLMPFVNGVNRLLHRLFHKIRDNAAMAVSLLIVYLLALGLIIMLLLYFIPQLIGNLADLVGQVPKAYAAFQEFMEYLMKHFPNLDLGGVENMVVSTQSDLTRLIQTATDKAIPVLYTASVSIVNWVVNLLIAIVMSVYMIHGKGALLRLIKVLVYAFTPERYLPAVKQTLLDCNRIFSSFLVSKMIDSLIIGFLCFILMNILRLPYAFLISAVVGVTNMIPYFGPFIGAIPGAIITLVVSPFKAFVFLIMILALQQFDGLYLGPKLMGSSVGMSPFWVIMAVTVGGNLFGVIGMFLGVPVMAMLAYLSSRYMRWRLQRKGYAPEDIH